LIRIFHNLDCQTNGVICGQRSYRQFTEVDFNLISKIREYLDEGYTLSTAAKKAAEGISTGKEEKHNGNK